MKYIVIKNEELDNLVRDVNMEIEMGMAPIGGIVMKNEFNPMYAQAMILEGKKRERKTYQGKRQKEGYPELEGIEWNLLAKEKSNAMSLIKTHKKAKGWINGKMYYYLLGIEVDAPLARNYGGAVKGLLKEKGLESPVAGHNTYAPIEIWDAVFKMLGKNTDKKRGLPYKIDE